jgi:hypothetical protein
MLLDALEIAYSGSKSTSAKAVKTMVEEKWFGSEGHWLNAKQPPKFRLPRLEPRTETEREAQMMWRKSLKEACYDTKTPGSVRQMHKLSLRIHGQYKGGKVAQTVEDENGN